MSLDFEHDYIEARILSWNSEEVYEHLARISAQPLPADDEWRCLSKQFLHGPADLDFLPDAYFWFPDGPFLVWGAYWLDRHDESNAIIAHIDRVREPFPPPPWFLS